MNLFGCKFCDKSNNDDDAQCDRKNFDTLLWALVTVFQVKMHNILNQSNNNKSQQKQNKDLKLYFIHFITTADPC